MNTCHDKICIICGRSIKSGRKYCWEHRHSGHSIKEDKEEKLFELQHIYQDFKEKQFLKEYKNNKEWQTEDSKKEWTRAKIYWGFVAIFLIIGGISQIGRPIFETIGAFIILIMIFGLIYTAKIVGRAKDKRLNEMRIKIREEVDKYGQDYVRFVKSKVRAEWKKKQFKDYLLKT